MHDSTFCSDSDHVLRGRNVKTPKLKINIGGRDGKIRNGKLGQFITKKQTVSSAAHRACRKESKYVILKFKYTIVSVIGDVLNE